MNEKLQYASMLEIPVNTCNITYKPAKKKGKKKPKPQPEEVKEQLLTKINSDASVEEEDASASLIVQEQEEVQEDYPQSSVISYSDKKPRAKRGFSIVALQLVIVGVLLATILITNAVYPNSGINAFMKGVFQSEQVSVVDDRDYSDFTPVLAFGGVGATVENGVIGITASGSVYAPCDGTVSALTRGEDGKYSLEITHNQNFKSTLTGLDYAYAQEGEGVLGNIPVGFVKDGQLKTCFFGENGQLITDYQISGNSVVWAV